MLSTQDRVVRICGECLLSSFFFVCQQYCTPFYNPTTPLTGLVRSVVNEIARIPTGAVDTVQLRSLIKNFTASYFRPSTTVLVFAVMFTESFPCCMNIVHSLIKVSKYVT